MARNNALDFVKGSAVFAMAVHHSINYFPAVYLSIRYVHFVSGAFPFLAGFIVSNVLVRRSAHESPRSNLGTRLLFRGIRLLFLCGLLNVLLAGVLGRMAKFGRLPASDVSECVEKLLWSGNYLEVSFSLLVPIAYVLIALGLLSNLGALARGWISTIACCLFVYCVAGEFWPIGITYYAGYFAIGMIGAAFGFIPKERIDAFCGKWWRVLVLFVCSLVTVVLFGQPFIVFAVNVTATLLMLYLIGLNIAPTTKFARGVAIVGRYSLLMYIAQIGILFIVRFILWNLWPAAANALFGFVAVCLGQYLLCLFSDRLRRKWLLIDRAYVAFFA
jgi:hypothetical protein